MITDTISRKERFGRSLRRLRLLARTLTLLTASFCCAVLQAQPADPPPVGQALAGKLHAELDHQRQMQGIIGASAAIMSPRHGSWSGGSGISDSANGVAVAPEMLFGIGSITKTFTAAAILQLVDEGRLQLDDSLHRWLPAYPNVDSTVTIRQLLSHTSGIANYTDNADFWTFTNYNLDRVFGPEEVLEFVGPSSFAPGTDWAYSNTNYLLLGMILEKITGESYETELARRLFTPLDLGSLAMGTSDSLPGAIAHNWEDIDGDGGLDDFTALPHRGVYSGAWSAGGLFGTASDLARWSRALYGGTVLTSGMLQQMTTFRQVPGLGTGGGYGLGAMRINMLGREAWGHTGGIIGYSSVVFYIPKDSISVVVLINQSEGNPVLIAARLLELVYRTSSIATTDRPTAAGLHLSLRADGPTPFAETTTVSYRLEAPSNVTARIYDLLGQQVRALTEGAIEAGEHAIIWDGTDDSGGRVPDGVYFCRVETGRGASSVSLVKMAR